MTGHDFMHATKPRSEKDLAELVPALNESLVENSVALLDYPYERAHWQHRFALSTSLWPQFEQQA